MFYELDNTLFVAMRIGPREVLHKGAETVGTALVKAETLKRVEYDYSLIDFICNL